MMSNGIPVVSHGTLAFEWSSEATPTVTSVTPTTGEAHCFNVCRYVVRFRIINMFRYCLVVLFRHNCVRWNVILRVSHGSRGGRRRHPPPPHPHSGSQKQKKTIFRAKYGLECVI